MHRQFWIKSTHNNFSYQNALNDLKEKDEFISNYRLRSHNHDILDLTLQNQLYCITKSSLRQVSVYNTVS